MMLNGKTVYLSDYHYMHRAPIEMLLNFGTDKKTGKLRAAFWYEDAPNHFDVLDDTNAGFQM